jgi:hypothetical protein
MRILQAPKKETGQAYRAYWEKSHVKIPVTLARDSDLMGNDFDLRRIA